MQEGQGAEGLLQSEGQLPEQDQIDPSLYRLRGGPESLQGISLRMIDPKSLMNMCVNRKATRLLIKDVAAIQKYLATRVK